MLAPLAMLMLAACAGSPTNVGQAEGPVRSSPSVAASQPKPQGVKDRAATIALAQVGVPYRYGGQSPSTGFDCSGLVHYAYREAGRSLPRTTASLWDYTERVPRSSLRRGDLVFFSIEGKMQHVGLYIGEGRFVHSPSSGRRVSVESLSSPFYSQALLSGGRFD